MTSHLPQPPSQRGSARKIVNIMTQALAQQSAWLFVGAQNGIARIYRISSFSPLATRSSGSTRNVPCYTDEESRLREVKPFAQGYTVSNDQSCH